MDKEIGKLKEELELKALKLVTGVLNGNYEILGAYRSYASRGEQEEHLLNIIFVTRRGDMHITIVKNSEGGYKLYNISRVSGEHEVIVVNKEMEPELGELAEETVERFYARKETWKLRRDIEFLEEVTL